MRKNQPHYENPYADFIKLLRENSNIDTYREPTGIRIRGDINIKPPSNMDRDKSYYAEYSALGFYNSLEGMTPRLAVDQEILSYINHVYLHEYGVGRWLSDGKPRRTAIRTHWLETRRDKIWNQNISGRLWWMAHAATAAARESGGKFSAKQALDLFVSKTEYYNRSMEFVVLRNPVILSECVWSLLEGEARGISIDGYRRMLHDLNLAAGARLLDALPQGGIRQLVKQMAVRHVQK